ncbi:hypothetical protein LUCX_231 [Xanthomonas phage vB_XciM_LucasX]|nr:hypothetical protein LUCX_231 [Xanthomonas phage vB_XciM_LucasX]
MQTVFVTLTPKAGWSLMSLFHAWVFDHYAEPNDPEILQDVSNLHFIVQGDGHSYGHIVDFLDRAGAIATAAHMGQLSLDYTREPFKGMGQLNRDLIRVMRTMEGPNKFVEISSDSVLSKACVVDLIRAQHERILELEAEIQSRPLEIEKNRTAITHTSALLPKEHP